MSIFLNNVRKIMNGDATAISESVNKPVEEIYDIGICEMILESMSECQRISADALLENIRTNDLILETVLKMENAPFNESIKLGAELTVLNESILGGIWKVIKALWQAFVNFLKKLVKRISFAFAQMSDNGEALVKKYGDEIQDVNGLRIKYYNYAEFERWADNLDVKVSAILNGMNRNYDTAYNNFVDIKLKNGNVEKFNNKLRTERLKMDKVQSDYSQKPSSHNICGLKLSEFVSYILSVENLKPGGVEEVAAQVKYIARGKATSPSMINATPKIMNSIKELLVMEGPYSKANIENDLQSVVNDISAFTEDNVIAMSNAMAASFAKKMDKMTEGEFVLARPGIEEVEAFQIAYSEAFKAESTLLMISVQTSINAIVSLMNERHALAKTAFADAYKFSISKRGKNLNESVFSQIDSDVPLDVILSIL
jgi:hypothetical protein